MLNFFTSLIKSTLFLGLVLLVVSCKPKEPEQIPETEVTLEMKFKMMFNGELIDLDQNLAAPDGLPFQIKEVKIILTQIKNNDLPLLDASKMDLSADGNTLFTAVGKPNDFKNLQGSVGVVQPWNNADPVSFPTSSPLYLSNVNDMHWGWNPGYIFYKFEGLFGSTAGSSELDNIFSYHLGMNDYLKNFSFENIDWIKINDSKYEATVILHVDELFSGPGGDMSFSHDPFTHSTPDKHALNERFSTNFAHALRAQ